MEVLKNIFKKSCFYISALVFLGGIPLNSYSMKRHVALSSKKEVKQAPAKKTKIEDYQRGEKSEQGESSPIKQERTSVQAALTQREIEFCKTFYGGSNPKILTVQASDLASYFPFVRVIRGLHVVDADDQTLSLLACFSGLTHLSLKECVKITDVGFSCLSFLKNLKALDLSQTNISDSALSYLKTLPLFSLILKFCQISGQGLEYLPETLHKLDLWGTSIGDSSLSHLSRLRRLKELDLSHTNVSAVGLKHLTALPLSSLSLNFCQISGSGLKYLPKTLLKLSFWCAQFKDHDLTPLAQLEKLRELDLSCTSITSEGLMLLPKTLTKLDISGNDIEDIALNYVLTHCPNLTFLATDNKYFGNVDGVLQELKSDPH